MNWGRWFLVAVGGASMLMLGACSSSKGGGPESRASTATAVTPVVSVVPAGQMERRAQEESKMVAAQRASAIAASQAKSLAKKAEGPVLPAGPAVWLYVSPSSQSYFGKAGLDGSSRPMVWESLLRKYQIPFIRIASIELLEKIPSNSVLLLPSNVALSEREMAAIDAVRDRGVSLLTTWLTGVRNEEGDWRGFDFMEKSLGVRVTGDAADAEDDNFMIVHGDNPVTHAIPAGTRVWLERIKGMLPLRLEGRNYAAQIMNWSRTYSLDKKAGLIVFDEQKRSSGKAARIVTLGYPEAVWASADPRMLEAIAHNAIAWLFRQTDAYLAAWPHPFLSATVLSIEGGDDVAEVDVEFAKRIESVGGKATYYVQSNSMSRAAPAIKRIQKRGHEIAYFGDSIDGFKDQGRDTQAKRLDTMQKGLDDAGIKVTDGGGFVAPMFSYDAVTEALLLERGIGHYQSFMDATDGRLPFFAKGTRDVNTATVVLPRTQLGPEESTEEGDPDEGMQRFLEEFALSESMGGLSVIRVPTQTILAQPHQDLLFDHLKARKDVMWTAPAADVARWWRNRAKVSVRIEPNVKAPILVVSVLGSEDVKAPVSVWVNLPAADKSLRLESADMDDPLPPVARLDAWRSVVLLSGLAPGEYCWYLYFDGPSMAGKK